MIIPKSNRLKPSQLKELQDIVAVFDCQIQVIDGAHRSIYAIVGDERHEVMINRILGLDYIDRVDTIESPYKLMDIRSELSGSELRIANTTLPKEPLFIAGPCTIDPKNPSLTLETAEAVKEAGCQVFRGGVWKPRTMPYSYQGSHAALDILLEAKERTGLCINTEVMQKDQLKLLIDAKVDMIQIGTRNALNYSLLKDVGEMTAGTQTVILLKRSRAMAPIDEFIAAAEYIAAAGNPNILLCPRGTMPNMDGYRNHPDESITQLLREKTWAGVIADPSHAVGRASYVPRAALAAMAYGAQGLCIEAHVNAKQGIGDDPKQAIDPHTLSLIISDAKTIHQQSLKY